MATFALDPTHSSVEFTARHMVFSRVRGAFPKFTLDLDVDETTNLPTAVNAVIDATSIDTNVTDRDNHLKSADFLDVATFPTITFAATQISGRPGALTIQGNLTIHGVTKPVTLNANIDGRAKDPWGNDRIAFTASATFNRKDFGLTWNQALETGGVLVGEMLEIAITIQAVNAQVAAA
jgi:polyisoprenoid-binding protein YceI